MQNDSIGQNQRFVNGRFQIKQLMQDEDQIRGRIRNMDITINPFNYAAFIKELTDLRDSFANPPLNHRTHESIEFKQWRHQVSDLIERIESKGYDINCRIGQRRFRVMSYGSISRRELQEAFDNAHAETMIELNTIINNFEKYGDPKARSSVPVLDPLIFPDFEKKKPLEWKKEATLMWYFNNTPAVTMWGFGVVIVSLILGAFLLGIAIEKRWPEAKPPVVSEQALKASPSDHTLATSKPASAKSVVQTPIDGQPVNHPTVQTPLNSK